ncbi:MAG: tripartite tricarboxylate transporter permease [Chloroflexi bacterium]|nr:tripartite tricarboxylate transporter permease [Chloroflexota bacterium]
METLDHLLYGLTIVLEPANLGFLLLGTVLGTLVGVLPGIGPQGAIALLLPLTYGMHPASTLIFLAGLYNGAMYGGSTTSILLNVPGESASVITCLDGYEMTRQGRAGPALVIAAVGSFIAGTLAVGGLTLIGPSLASIALRFGPAEYFSLMLLGLATTAGMVGRSVAKSAAAALLGLMFATVGVDMSSGVPRYSLGLPALLDGIDFLVLTLGLFAVSEVLVSLEEARILTQGRVRVGRLWLSLRDFLASLGAILRGGVIGFVIGVLPGAGPIIASFLSYSVEKQLSRHPERFGKGEIRGVAAPESANNAAATGALVPLLALGIPGSGTAALMLGALLMAGVRPGPLLFAQHPDVAWGLIASLYLGNLMLLALNIPLVGVFIRILHVPLAVMLPAILALSFIGVYSVNRSVFDLGLMLIFGGLGYYLRKHDYPLASLVLAFVLGGLMEQNFRRALMISGGDYTIFVRSGLSAAMLAASVAFLVLPFLVKRLRSLKPREEGQA